MISKKIIFHLIFLIEVIYFISNFNTFEYEFEKYNFIAKSIIIFLLTVLVVKKYNSDDRISDTEIEV